jgi:signal peptidase II
MRPGNQGNNGIQITNTNECGSRESHFLRLPQEFHSSLDVLMKIKYYLVSLIILILDYATKQWALAALAPSRTIEIIPGFFRFSYAQNTGVAFGLFDSAESAWKPYVLTALAILAIIGIIIYGRQMAWDRKLLHLALAITAGGITGNLADRIFRGYVIDFIECHFREIYTFPNFNIADSAITIGVALLLIDTIIFPNTEEVQERPAEDGR